MEYSSPSCPLSPSPPRPPVYTDKLLYPQEKRHCNGRGGVGRIVVYNRKKGGCPKQFVEDYGLISCCEKTKSLFSGRIWIG